MKDLKPIPKLKNEKEWARFWMTHDSTEYVDWSKAKKTIFPNLKPTYKSISLRLPVYMLDEIKLLANKKDVPYQSLMKVFLGANESIKRTENRQKVIAEGDFLAEKIKEEIAV